MFTFKLPDIGEGVAEAEVVTWFVTEGEKIDSDQPIVELMTDKATVEIPSPRGGVVHRLCYAEGDIIPVGEILIEIDEGGEAKKDLPAASESSAVNTPKSTPATTATPPQKNAPNKTATPPPSPATRTTSTSPASTAKSVGGAAASQPPRMPARPSSHPRECDGDKNIQVDAVPAVREYAKRKGVELNCVNGSGPAGRIMRRDVDAYLTAPHTQPSSPAAPAKTDAPCTTDEPDWTRKPLRGLRRLIAERMVQSSSEIPHFTYAEEIDLTVLETKRKDLTAAHGGKEISPLAFIAQAVVRTLPQYPMLNAAMDTPRQELILKEKIHLGIAAATEDGLLVPVIRDADGKSVAELAAAMKDLAVRAREKKLAPDELRGSTFSITSLGKLAGVFSTPIINHPEVAILGISAIRTLPRYIDDELQPRKIMNLCVSMDHRAVDGMETALFVQAVKEILETANFAD